MTLSKQTQAIIGALKNSRDIDWDQLNYVVRHDGEKGNEYIVIWAQPAATGKSRKITTNNYTPLPVEAVKLSLKLAGSKVLHYVKDIESAWSEQYGDPSYNHTCMLAAVFTAGYLQGKREERAKCRRSGK